MKEQLPERERRLKKKFAESNKNKTHKDRNTYLKLSFLIYCIIFSNKSLERSVTIASYHFVINP